MRKLVFTIALLSLFSSIAYASEWDPGAAQRAFRRLAESRNIDDFLSNCSAQTRGHILSNRFSFKDVSDLALKVCSIKAVRKLSESELKSLDGSPYERSLLENAVIIEISKEKGAEGSIPCYAFINENGEWVFDLLLSAKFSIESVFK
ncbi:MAG: hypothetical protein WC491_05245 [Candidatus Omnitrophota bacterium]